MYFSIDNRFSYRLSRWKECTGRKYQLLMYIALKN